MFEVRDCSNNCVSEMILFVKRCQRSGEAGPQHKGVNSVIHDCCIDNSDKYTIDVLKGEGNMCLLDWITYLRGAD